MNALRPITSVPHAPTRLRTTERPLAVRPERDFGIGYGASSGYATARRYGSNWAPPRFRCA